MTLTAKGLLFPSLRQTLVVVVPFSVAFGGSHTWSTGKVLDTTVNRDVLATGFAFASQTWDKQIIIQGEHYQYVVDDLTLKAVGLPTRGILDRAVANRKHGCRMVVGDSIQYAPEKGKLFILDADGKECKLDIVRQERIPGTASTPLVSPTNANLPVVPVTETGDRSNRSTPLHDADILKLMKAGFSEQMILAKIQSSPGMYELGTDDLWRMKAAGVSENIMMAMMSSLQK